MVAEKGIPDGGKYVGPPSERRRSAVSPPSVRRLAAVGAPSRRSKDARAQARQRGYQYMRIRVYVLSGAYEGRSVQLRTIAWNGNGCDTSLIWTYSQVGSIRCGRGVSVVFIATHYSALYAALSAALSAFA